MSEFKLPAEVVELPSKGLVYPKDNPLSSGKLEMKYMTAKEEDILTNMNYIRDGIVIDKLLQSLVVSKINYDDLIIGDKNALLIAARVLGYGKDYIFEVTDEDGNKVKHTCDLTQLPIKEIDQSLFTPGKNEFSYKLPASGNEITFKLLTHGDEKKIAQELKGLQKINPKGSFDRTTRLKYMITSVNGATESAAVREFVDKHLLAKDSRSLRNYIQTISPDIDLTYYPDGAEEGITIPLGIDFFWPDTKN